MSQLDAMDSLLGIARETLRRDIQPTLPPDQRYLAAMIAHAMAIAARAAAIGADSRERQRLALATLHPGEAALAALERRLAGELRRTKPSPEREEQIRAVLLARTLARLEVSNPDYPDSFADAGQAR
ncbi:MAG: DUF6285 domain-containing protein [Geminicoccaceae bacterium]